MSNYKVTKRDLIKDLKGFPIEVVEKMLERQREQTGTEDITVFQNNSISFKGFDWKNTIEGCSFWNDVIFLRNFNLFFEKYPKKTKYVYIYQDGTKNEKDVINTLIKYGGVDSFDLNGDSTDSIYYIRPDDSTIVVVDPDSHEGFLVKTFYTEIQPEPSVKEYTMQEIADKLGIKVDELRIKK
jgi:hypothetical protein